MYVSGFFVCVAVYSVFFGGILFISRVVGRLRFVVSFSFKIVLFVLVFNLSFFSFGGLESGRRKKILEISEQGITQ